MNFKNIVEQISSNVKYEKKPIDISTWAQYKVKDGKIHHLNPTIKLSDNEEIINAINNISFEIGYNMYKYKKKYDELHGEGAYDRLYYLEPIYPNLDKELEEEEKEEKEEQNEENYNYEQNTHCY